MKPNYNIFTQNKCVDFGDYLLISLNLEDDFAFDIDQIVIKYYKKLKIVEICTDEIPSNIKKNMTDFYKEDINEYIYFLQCNIETFLKGEVPLESTNSKAIIPQDDDNFTDYKDQPFILPKTFIFPAANIKGLNIEYDCVKKNIGIIAAKNINAQVICSNCNLIQSISNTKSCFKCRSELIFNYQPTVNPVFLGKLTINNCKFICFNANKFQLSCFKCNINYETNEIGLKSVFNIKCYGCKYEIYFVLNKLEYRSKFKQDIKFHFGQCLPEKGACEHYKKSFRWFRFTCCKQVFPCDICHDIKSDHKSERAHKMICGMCSKEQVCKDQCDCGMSLNKVTTHWEGGKGMRNKETMSKKDNKKYKK